MNMPNHFHRSARHNRGGAQEGETPAEKAPAWESCSDAALPLSHSTFSQQNTLQARRAALYVFAACLVSAGFPPEAWSEAPALLADTIATGQTARPRTARMALAIMTGRGSMMTGLELPASSRIARMDSWSGSAFPGLSSGSAFTPQSSHFSPNTRAYIRPIAFTAADGASAAKPSTTKSPAAQSLKTRPVKAAVKATASKATVSAPVAKAAASAARITTVQQKTAASDGVRSASQQSIAVQPGAVRVNVKRTPATPWLMKVVAQTPVQAAGGPTQAILPLGAGLRSASPLSMPGRGLLPPAMLISQPPLAVSQPAQLLPISEKTTPQMGWRDAKGAPMRKVITVASLKQLPPATQPLPAWMRKSTISVDKLVPTAPHAKNAQGGRLAQNPSAPPLRQPSQPVMNSDRLPNQIEVSVGTFVVLLTNSDLDTVAVAEPGIADVAVVNSRSVLVNGKAPGVTSLVIVDRFRIRQYQVRVVAAPGTLPRDIASQIGLPGVGVRQVRDAIILEGEVENAEELRRAVEIAGVFSAKVINQLTVRGAPSSAAAIETQIQRAINMPNVTVQLIGTDTALLQGTVERSMQRQQAENVASAFVKRVVNLIDLPPLTLEQVQESFGPGPVPTDGTIAPMMGLNQPTIRARQVGDQIILEGTALNQGQIDQALVIAGRTGLQVVNRVQVAAAESALMNSVISAIGLPGVTATGNAKLLVLHGVVPDSNAAIRAEQVALSYATGVQNLLQTANPLLVNVDVSVVEINKAKFSSLGITFPGLAETVPGFGGGQVIGSIPVGNVAGTSGTTFTATLRALVNNNNARILSNPRSTVLSGRTAGFLVGGQIPVPVGSTTNESGTTISIAFKDFGILVNVVPVANPDGVITMRVFTDVSQIDGTIGFDFPGASTIPGFTKRTAVSEVTVNSGGTIALSGLMNNTVSQAVRRIPVLSKIPILGSLFTSKSFQRNETELVFFITPRLLPNPLRPGQTAPVTVINALENQGTPFYGTNAQQTTPVITSGSSDGRGLPPVATGPGLTIQSNTSGGGSAGGGS